jgi:DNA polymerase-3 subunit epsilon
MKRLFFDVETTGLKANRHSIHQIAGMVVIDNEIIETFDIKMQPNPKAEIDPEALKIAGVTKEQIMAYQPFAAGYNEFINLVNKHIEAKDKKDKFHLVGYNNASFDNDMLRGLLKQNNNKYFGSYFWSDSIDVMVMASFHLEAVRASMDNFKLKTVAAFLGIPVDETKLHNALYDIELTKAILDKITP